MREIKFQGKRTDNGEWVCGDLIHESWGIVIQYEEVVRSTGVGAPEKETTKRKHKVSIIPETIGEFIGLHDQYGKEIYEGNLLSPIFDPDNVFCVIWRNGEFIASNPKIEFKINAIAKYCTIIGNIFDSHELLETNE